MIKASIDLFLRNVLSITVCVCAVLVLVLASTKAITAEGGTTTNPEAPGIASSQPDNLAGTPSDRTQETGR